LGIRVNEEDMSEEEIDEKLERRSELIGEVADIDNEVNDVEPDDVRELYEIAATFADVTDSPQEFAEVLESEIGEPLDEKYGESERMRENVPDYNLDRTDFNSIMALYHSLNSSERDVEGAVPGEFSIEELGVGLTANTERGKGLSDLSRARLYESFGNEAGKSARSAVEQRYNEGDERQAALIAETFGVDSASLEKGVGSREREVEDVARKYVEDRFSSGDYKEAVGLADDVERPELLEDIIGEDAIEDMSGEEAMSIVSAGYQSEEVIEAAANYAEDRILAGDREAYDTLEELTDHEAEEYLSAEAKTALTAI
jgi:hypothetical protein